MPNLQQFSPAYNKYLPAVLRHNSDGYYVEYYSYNPVTDKLERKRMLVNMLRKRSRTTSEFKVQVNEIICTINTKLAGGWSPFGQVENIREYATIEEVTTAFLKEKRQELRANSMRSYESFCNIFSSWVARTIPKCKCILFNRTHAVRFMDELQEKHLRARSYNNNLKLARALFSWAVQKCYCKENPFEQIKPKRPEAKIRTIIPPEHRAKIKEYLQQNNPQFLIICELVYTSLIRPAEIERIKVEQIDLKEKCIYLPETQTKNGHHRHAPLSDELVSRLEEHTRRAKPTDYLFANKQWTCGKTSMRSHTYGNYWRRMCKALKFPDTYQLYSLRDTGINNMLKAGIDPLTVMQAADHHDLSMTTRYANHADPNLIRTLNEKAPAF